MTIMASDGRSDIRAEGSVIQLASSRRGLARVLLTVLGGLAMIVGSLLTFVADSDNSAVELTAEWSRRRSNESNRGFGIRDDLDAGGFDKGLHRPVPDHPGRTRDLRTHRQVRPAHRIAALLGAVVVVATFVGSATVAGGSGPAAGALLAFAGCVAAYVGGLLARR